MLNLLKKLYLYWKLYSSVSIKSLNQTSSILNVDVITQIVYFLSVDGNSVPICGDMLTECMSFRNLNETAFSGFGGFFLSLLFSK